MVLEMVLDENGGDDSPVVVSNRSLKTITLPEEA
jgi:hypothetical protein